ALINGRINTWHLVPPPPFGAETPYMGWQLYDPVADTWSLGHSLTASLAYPTEALLQDGQVLVAAGQPLGFDPTTYLYHPTANTVTAAPEHICLRIPGGPQPVSIRLLNGRVLLVCAKSNTQGPTLYLPAGASDLGAPCVKAAECASGFCADGVCCDSACNA